MRPTYSDYFSGEQDFSRTWGWGGIFSPPYECSGGGSIDEVYADITTTGEISMKRSVVPVPEGSLTMPIALFFDCDN